MNFVDVETGGEWKMENGWKELEWMLKNNPTNMKF
jgi:hypothetical protein